VIVLLGVVNVLDHEVSGISIWLGVPCAAGLVVLARCIGLSWNELGLGADRVRAGAIWAGAAILAVSAVYAIAVLVPATRRAFLDSRYHVSAVTALTTAFVRIPLGTIVFEEVAFRGVLWALFARLMTPVRVLFATSALFGLWHVLPSLHLASANAGVADAVGGTGGGASVLAVVGAVGLTAVGGVVFGEARRRSGSLLASAGLHWATNGLGVLFGLLAWHLQ
jgi:membrane protease YdiL (CAAX protease family)